MKEAYLSMLRRRLPFVLLVTVLLAPLVFFAVNSGAETYRSTAVIEVGTSGVAESVLGQSGAYVEPERRIATELEVFQSPQVSGDAVKRLSEQGIILSEQDAVNRLTASARRGTNYIEVQGTGTSPDSAQRLTRGFVEAYFDYRSDLQRGELLRLQEGLQSRLDAAQTELQALTASGGSADSPEGSDIRDRVTTARDLVEAVQLRLSVDTSQAQLLSPASLPTEPSDALTLPVALLTSLVGALGLAAAALFGLELLKDPVRTRHEAQQLAAAPVLATIPCSTGQNFTEVSQQDLPRSTAGRMLKIRIDGFSLDEPVRRVLLSTMAGDAEAGRCAALALAAASAQAGLRVLVIADNVAGTSLHAPDEVQRVDQAANPVVPTTIDGMTFLRATSVSGDSSALFDSSSPADTLDSLSSSFDVTILLVSGHSSVSAESVSHLFQVTLVVCALGRTRGRKFRSFLADLRMNGVLIAGVVTTMPTPRRTILHPRRRNESTARRDESVGSGVVSTSADWPGTWTTSAGTSTPRAEHSDPVGGRLAGPRGLDDDTGVVGEAQGSRGHSDEGVPVRRR